MKNIPEFKTELERQQWFIANADYYTAITRRNLRNERKEFPTLQQAEQYAITHLKNDQGIRSFLLYAVVNMSDSFVKSVLRDETCNMEK